MSKDLNFVVLGPPLCGKGTQSGFLAKEFGLLVVSPGEIFREAIADNTELGRQVKDIVQSGKLVSDEIVVTAVRSRIDNSHCRDGFILDGFPRTMGQLGFLDAFWAATNKRVAAVIKINIDKEETIKRSRGRARIDDRSVDVLETRLEAYKNQTLPVISAFRKRKLVIEIDGIGTIENVWKRIRAQIQKRLDQPA